MKDPSYIKYCRAQRSREIRLQNDTCGSRHQRRSIKKGVLKNFAKFTGKHLRQSLFFNKVAGLRHKC